MTHPPTDTTAHIAARPEPQRATLEQLRTTIRVAAPDAQESFGYGMPEFTLGGRPHDLVTHLVQARAASLRAGGR